MCRLLCPSLCALCLVLSASPRAHAEPPAVFGAEDNTIVPGRRVGAITAYSSLAVLKALYGAASIRPKMQPMPAGDTAPGARLFEGTDRQLDLVWEEDAREKRVAEVRVVGAAWKLANGLKTGLGLAEVEKINPGVKAAAGTPPGGLAGSQGGASAQGLDIRFSENPASLSKKTPAPDGKHGTASVEVRSAVPVVTQIVVSFR